jgi:hypothetical protein
MGKNPAYTIKGNAKYVDLSLLFSKGMGLLSIQHILQHPEIISDEFVFYA